MLFSPDEFSLCTNSIPYFYANVKHFLQSLYCQYRIFLRDYIVIENYVNVVSSQSMCSDDDRK
jgi:hypothetical protein